MDQELVWGISKIVLIVLGVIFALKVALGLFFAALALCITLLGAKK